MAIIILGILYVLFGGFYIWRYDGGWCIATNHPQICWKVGSRSGSGLSKAVSTGWNKCDSKDVWYKKI